MTDFLIAYSFYALLAALVLCSLFSYVASQLESARGEQVPSAYENHFPRIAMQQQAEEGARCRAAGSNAPSAVMADAA